MSSHNVVPNRGDVYEAVTRGIRIEVSPRFLDDQSEPEDNQYTWAYSIVVFNESDETVQLKTRTWIITDANGTTENVHGAGVVGEQPILNPGDSFSYTSGCPLTTPSGFMVGHYTMQREDKTEFDVAIPAFSLDLPGARIMVN